MTGPQPHRDYPPRARLSVRLALVVIDVLAVAAIVSMAYCTGQGFGWLVVRYWL